MAIFVSYSHQDSDFVDQLAIQLADEKAQIWIDRWELNVGDSLLDKVQHAIENAGALLIVLSKASVESAWCKKELNAGLVRELDEKKVIVLPVLKDCTIPIFLREKMYADFRGDFEKGFQSLLSSEDGRRQRQNSACPCLKLLSPNCRLRSLSFASNDQRGSKAGCYYHCPRLIGHSGLTCTI